ncbi:cytochrome c oxidase assembly protein [Aurantimicrobium sp. MWH-Uga1]|uniref:cytochrome c oxidase assembly protein n=1 Tax=Aurantimicrobium sp. MWH-Uga1 TaxID=2079575 RepID=UPI000DF04C3C|nr:cytochrome c oxidase assembly protein [Aurantimicrobium sp. MWH-Uga1]AXE53769.1 Copper transport protein YcnJ precursor [Aurantimicrobium sp. MWH-Uga1]
MSRLFKIAAPALALLVAFVALLIALAIGGGSRTQALGDPGDVVRIGLPIAKLVVNLSAATLIGSLALALWAFASREKAYFRSIDIAAAAALVLTLASAATSFLTFLNVSAMPFSLDDKFGNQLGFFLTEIALGQAWLITTIVAAFVAVLCIAVTNQTALFFVGLAAVGTLVPMALQGHAAGVSGHAMAITSMGLHLVFVSVWLGGVVTLVLLRGIIEPDRLQIIVSRFSTLAIIAFIVVAVSGVANAMLRVGTLENLFGTAYGQLVLAKVAAMTALGVFGFWQRGFLVKRMTGAAVQKMFWWFIAIELVVMGIASGIAAGLARTPTPVDQVLNPNPTPAEILTGEPLPPEFTFMRLFTEWRIDLIWMLVCGFGIFFYLVGVYRLHKRGDKWPWYRAVLWVSGLLLLFYITSGGINAYEMYLFSAHMGAHMALGMMVPILLVPGAPVTLAMRAIDKRQDDSRGGREWILKAVHSGYANVISNPIFATVNFVGSLWLFYYTPIFRWATSDHIGHEWMIVHFLLAGYLFVQSLIGIDPVKSRLPYPFRLIQLLAAMTVHAFFGLGVMSSESLMLADWYGAMGRTWGSTPLEDQQAGGAIAWSVGEIPNMILSLILGYQWFRSDAKEAKRKDRQADRTDDAELKAYNEMLARQAQRDAQQI